MDDFKIENGELIAYSGNKDNITIPEGVISISGDFDCETETKTVVLPKSIKHIGNRAFKRWAAYTGDYNGVILILFGIEIDLTDIYYDNYEEFDDEAAFESFLDKAIFGDEENEVFIDMEAYRESYYEDNASEDSWEHYNNLERSIREGVIDEINAILEKNNDYKFKYIPSETVEEIIKNMNN